MNFGRDVTFTWPESSCFVTSGAEKTILKVGQLILSFKGNIHQIFCKWIFKRAQRKQDMLDL
jgi:hypothetical protein